MQRVTCRTLLARNDRVAIWIRVRDLGDNERRSSNADRRTPGVHLCPASPRITCPAFAERRFASHLMRRAVANAMSDVDTDAAVDDASIERAHASTVQRPSAACDGRINGSPRACRTPARFSAFMNRRERGRFAVRPVRQTTRIPRSDFGTDIFEPLRSSEVRPRRREDGRGCNEFSRSGGARRT